MSQDSRRFTDREVALVLQRATELDDADVSAAGGLSLTDLREIAAEVGISAAAIDRAVATLGQRGPVAARWAGAPNVRKAVHAVSGELDRDGVARVMAVVDDTTDATGTITEALGSVRWTGRDRFKSTRVSVTPKDGETTIEVVEKAEPKMRRVFHLLPPAWAAMAAGPIAAQLGVLGVPLIALLAGSLGAGWLIGRGAWSLVSAASDRRVHALAERLAAEASGPGGA